MEFNAIETSAGGGVLAIYCAASNHAPHRLTTTNEAYVRRGASTVRMTMLEIQEMSVNTARGLERLPRLFEERRSAFRKWIGGRSGAVFRITCIPIRPIPDPGRLFGTMDQDIFVKRHTAQFGDRPKKEILLPLYATQTKPVLRGVQNWVDNEEGKVAIHQFQDGTVDIWFWNAEKSRRSSELELYLYHGWVLGAAAKALHLVDSLRARANVHNAECIGNRNRPFQSEHKPIFSKIDAVSVSRHRCR